MKHPCKLLYSKFAILYEKFEMFCSVILCLHLLIMCICVLKLNVCVKVFNGYVDGFYASETTLAETFGPPTALKYRHLR